MIKMLAFDLDGTLLNTINDIGDAMNVALKKYDLPLRKEEEYPSFVGGGIIELTKASDIVASRTYEYFFPLIIAAIIYLIITLSLSKLISIRERKLNNANS